MKERPPYLRYLNILPVIMICSVLFYCSGANGREDSDGSEILVIGTSRVSNENIAAARNAAISDALTKGVEEYLTGHLGSQGMINNFERLVQDVIPGSRETVENFNILTEERHENEYKILAHIKVNKNLMEEMLKNAGVILVEGSPVKLLFLVSENMTDTKEVSFWWSDPESNSIFTPVELLLHKEFQERGFSPVNRQLSVDEEKISPEMRESNLNENEAFTWGEVYSADFVIFGEEAIIENRMISLRINLLDMKDKTILSQVNQLEIIQSGSTGEKPEMETLKKIIKSAASKLSPVIIQAYAERDNEINKMEIEVRGLKSFEQFRRFTEFLKQDPSVLSVTQTRIKGNSMTVMTEFSGGREKFIKKLTGSENFPFLADISRTDEGGVIIDIK